MDINLHYGENDAPLLIFDDYSIFLQELELGIKILTNEIWNKPNGLDISEYLFNKYVSKYSIHSEVKTFIERECSKSNLFDWDLKIDFIQQANDEFILINVIIKNNNKPIENKFLIS